MQTKKIHKQIQSITGRKVFVVCNIALLLLLSFVFLAPYVATLAKALNSAADTSLGGLGFIPRDFTWDNFKLVLSDTSLIDAFIFTVTRTLVGSVWAVFVQFAAAYALLQKGLWGKKFILALFTVPMFLQGGLVAQMATYSVLGITNTFFVFVLPSAFSFYNMVVMRTYLSGISDSYKEAARLDGAKEATIMLKIYLPLSMPVVATVLLWTAVFYWNDWTTTLYFTYSKEFYTLQYHLQMTMKQAEQIAALLTQAAEKGMPIGEVDSSVDRQSVEAASIIVVTLPILCVYPFLQRFFIKGVALGGVKE